MLFMLSLFLFSTVFYVLFLIHVLCLVKVVRFRNRPVWFLNIDNEGATLNNNAKCLFHIPHYTTTVKLASALAAKSKVVYLILNSTVIT